MGKDGRIELLRFHWLSFSVVGRILLTKVREGDLLGDLSFARSVVGGESKNLVRQRCPKMYLQALLLDLEILWIWHR